MIEISSAELQSNTQKYLELAATDERVFVRGEGNISYELTTERYFEPDEEFHNSMSAEEFLAEAHKMIDRLYKLPR